MVTSPLQRIEGAPGSQPFPERPLSASGETAQPSEAPVPQAPIVGATQDADSTHAAANDFSTRSTTHEQRQEPVGSGHDVSTNQTDPPPVLAPNPVLPNWGGANQLFGNGRGMAGLGNNAPSETSIDEPPRYDEDAPRSSPEKTSATAPRWPREVPRGKAVVVARARPRLSRSRKPLTTTNKYGQGAGITWRLGRYSFG